MKIPRRGSLRAALVTSVALSALLLAGCTGSNGSGRSGDGSAAGSGSSAAAKGPWSYEDATGKTVKLDSTPKRVVVLNDIAISFIEYGLRPVGTFGQLTMAKDQRFEGLDTKGIAQLGTGYGDIDLEQLAALKPDLVVTSVYPTDDKGTLDTTQPGYGFKDKEQQQQVEAIAPVVQVEWGGKGEDVIEKIADLAESLGAPESTVEAAEDRFDKAEDELEKAAKASDVSVVSMYADGDGAYVTRPSDEPTLQMYSSFGVDFVTPKPKGFYWGIYSWENAGQISGDVILLSQQGYQVSDLEKQPTFADNAALQAGQVHSWTFPALDYASQADYMTKLAGWLGESKKVS
ncbi:ABC transporter substrate-binding protein [Curtobacterium sp. Csp1]|uniref:ABC transporter substrate-binding protein n=1 Tax=unclassified Curtobacterium TaxID=257496 RepID=UPI001598BE5F|nr:MULTISPECIES: ABC transporter substrate-binding protein [unclassified Curtobacterium]QKS13542.1 ABC transporter substrate-binding protein [Curtobacterium sp. csp3]QKS20589.1 ABC transporter substrate-binding protein [Curtobacterium sp. Csp1]QKS21640.1 ABC transporter substrate-binding protein [Curtobacterium sp. Csp1]